jgi:hypothetical protein
MKYGKSTYGMHFERVIEGKIIHDSKSE